jgi:Tfp pilus assembly protein PilO
VNDRAKLRMFDALLQTGLLMPVLLGSLLAYLLVLSPLRNQTKAAQARWAEVEKSLESASAVRRENQALKNKLADLESRAELVRQRIPDGPEEAEFLQTIHQAAEEAGLALEDYRRGNVIAGPRHAQLEVHLIGSGDYEGLCRFFERVDQLQRQTQPKTVVIRADSQPGFYRLDLTLLLFYRTPS